MRYVVKSARDQRGHDHHDDWSVFLSGARAGQTGKSLNSTPRTATSRDEDVRRSLSSEQRRVLDLIAVGKSDREIALDLGLTRVTVSNLVSRVLQALAVPDRAAARNWATRKGGSGAA